MAGILNILLVVYWHRLVAQEGVENVLECFLVVMNVLQLALVLMVAPNMLVMGLLRAYSGDFPTNQLLQLLLLGIRLVQTTL